MRHGPDQSTPPILPVGTAVVTLAEIVATQGRPGHACGVAGVIVASPMDPDHSYRVRFPGGDEHSLKRREMQTLSHHQSAAGEAEDALREYDLSGHVIYRCVVGSRAYGLDRDGSDVDVRGIYLPPARLHWSIYGVPEQLENDERQECFWELGKFIRLALKANPNVLEALYSPLVLSTTPTAERLRGARHIFLSRFVHQTFSGYAVSQFRKIEQDFRTRGEVKWKHAMHLIRLLHSGIGVLRTGDLTLRADEHRDVLLQIRDGRMAWDEVDALRLRLHKEFEEALEATLLPARPDYEAANALLVDARAEMARRED